MPRYGNENLQVHEESSHPLTAVLGVKFVLEVVKVGLILLTNIVVEDLQAFPVFCPHPNLSSHLG